jgi:hypothetical protein
LKTMIDIDMIKTCVYDGEQLGNPTMEQLGDEWALKQANLILRKAYRAAEAEMDRGAGASF